MKSSWVTSFAVAGVLAVLTLFLGLQYNWLYRASEAERERMQRRADADTKNFADDFNREIQAAYFNFQTNAEDWEKQDWSDFSERYDYWKAKTAYPDLIRDILFVPDPGGGALRFDASSHRFVTAELPADAANVVARLKDRSDLSFDDSSILVMPVFRRPKDVERILLRRPRTDGPLGVHLAEHGAALVEPENFGSLLILLDRDVIAGRIFPELAAKYFPEGNYNVSVKDRAQEPVYRSAGDTSGSDSSAGLLSLSPDNMIFFGDRGIFRRPQGEPAARTVINERIESRTFTRTENGPEGTRTGKFTIELKPGPEPPNPNGVKARTSVFAGSSPAAAPWTLSVQHTAGSIDAFTRGQFRNNFLIGLGLYLLLVGAIVAIVLSAMRSKRFAQRQIDFVSSVSHEFRTPLAVIYSAGENLADGVANDHEQVTRYGTLIKGEGKKLSAMVEQILQFAGARSGKRRYNFTEVKPSDLVSAALNECSPVLDEKGFQVETEIAPDLPLVRADADALSSAIQNLISNSIKYSNGSRWIKVSASNGNRRIKFKVEDRGIGIAGEDLKQLFEPFYRARSVVDAQIHGNGLGLALVKEIAEAHGGDVRVRSEAGTGSEFTLDIPQA